MEKILKDAKTVNEMSERISKFITEIKDNDYLEGVFYIGCFSPDTVILSIVYNSVQYDTKKDFIRMKPIYNSNDGLDLKIEHIPYWWYESEEMKKKRLEYPIEFSLCYGELLYDKTGNLTKLKQILKQDESLANDLDYWQDVCEFEPPVQYIKK